MAEATGQTDNPGWLSKALDTPSERAEVQVNGARIAYETWGDVGNRGIVLIHGSNAHLEWWRFTAPFLADRFRVVALDLSGNGDSDWRPRYSRNDFADEVWAVCQAAELGERPFVVGHSFGGFVALETGHQHSAELGGILFLDFTTAPPDQSLEWGLRAERDGVEPGRKLRVYPTKEAAMARFRFLPEQPHVHPTVMQHLAANGIHEVEGGWTWKFDPTLFDYLEMGVDQHEKFLGLKCRSALVLGEHSEDEGAFYAEHMAAVTGGLLPAVTIPDTYHHMMFDNPPALAMAVKLLLLEWHRQDHADALAQAIDAAAATAGQTIED